jgi:hypothetical protein
VLASVATSAPCPSGLQPPAETDRFEHRSQPLDGRSRAERGAAPNSRVPRSGSSTCTTTGRQSDGRGSPHLLAVPITDEDRRHACARSCPSSRERHGRHRYALAFSGQELARRSGPTPTLQRANGDAGAVSALVIVGGSARETRARAARRRRSHDLLSHRTGGANRPRPRPRDRRVASPRAPGLLAP